MRFQRLLRSAALTLATFVFALGARGAWAQPSASASQPGETARSAPIAQGWLWSSLIFGELFEGPPTQLTHYLERYGVRKGFGADRRTALFADIADFSLVHFDGRRDRVTLERHVASRYNQRAAGRFEGRHVRVSGRYGSFGQAASGLDYLFAPSIVSGGVDPAFSGGTVGYLGRFNDNVGDGRLATTRTTYGLAIDLKPSLFADKASATVGLQGIDRSGRMLASLNMGGGDVVGTDADRRAKLRWQGYESTVDDSTTELNFTAALRPSPRFSVEYELGYERFRNAAPTYTFSDLAATAGLPFAASAAEAGAAGALNVTVAGWPLHFQPDSNLLRQSVRGTAGGGRVLVAAGAGWNALTQETFTGPQLAANYRQGDVASTLAFTTVAVRPVAAVRLEAYARRAGTDRRMDRFETKLRLNAFTVWTYGVEAELRPGRGRVTLTPGWTRRAVDRDIQFGDVPAPRVLYGAESSSDEAFVRARVRLSPKLSLRATPSVLRADRAGLVTEPSRAAKLNIALAYAEVSRSVSAFYMVRSRRNDTLSFVGADRALVTQDATGFMQTLGVSGAAMPRETANLSWSYVWNRDRGEADLLSTTTRRYDAAPVFYSRGDRQQYLIGSHTMTVGVDFMPRSRVSCGASYLAARTAGHAASGTVLSLLPAEDGRIESWSQAASVRMEADLRNALRLGVTYTLDYYADGSYTLLSGGLNSLVVGVGYRF